MVVTCALINDELNLAAFRRQYYQDLVDHHYFFEANLTHSGTPKPLHLAESQLFASVPNVTVVRIPIPSQVQKVDSRWAIEEYSRDWAMWFVARRHPDDLIVLSDIDEIPSIDQLAFANGLNPSKRILSLPLVVSHRRVNWKSSEYWGAAKAFIGRNASPGIRFYPAKRGLGVAGAHLKYMGFRQPEIRRKHADFAHDEFDSVIGTSPEVVEICDAYRLAYPPRLGGTGRIGLLTVLENEGLGPVEKAYANFRPDHFGPNGAAHSKLTRLRMAYCVSIALETPGPLSSKIMGQLHGFIILPLVKPLATWLLHATKIALITRLVSRVINLSAADFAMGRRIWHIGRGVYRHGDYRAWLEEGS